MSKPMKTLTLGDTIYEIVDEDVRKRVTTLEAKSANMLTSINGIDNKIDTKSEELETKINNKITNPETGEIGHILVVKEIDENGKPIAYEAIENIKSTYEYAKLGGYTGTEEEFYQKLAQENATKAELNDVHVALINQLSDVDSNFTNSINEIIARVETIEAKIDAAKEENSEPEVV